MVVHDVGNKLRNTAKSPGDRQGRVRTLGKETISFTWPILLTGEVYYLVK